MDHFCFIIIEGKIEVGSLLKGEYESNLNLNTHITSLTLWIYPCNQLVAISLKKSKSEGWIIGYEILLKNHIKKIFWIIMVLQFFVGILNNKNLCYQCCKNDADRNSLYLSTEYT